MKSYTYTVGSAYRRDVMIRLDELDLPYTEHRAMFDSTIVVKTYDEAHKNAYRQFELEMTAFMKRLAERDRQWEKQEQEQNRLEVEKKLARKNRFRHLTFRKPLKNL